jgi:hypothetical protein
MTPVRFDLETATLRLDRETFAAPIAHATQPTGNASLPAELEAVGALHEGRYHPALEQGLDAVLNPVCRLQVRVADPHGLKTTATAGLPATRPGFCCRSRASSGPDCSTS